MNKRTFLKVCSAALTGQIVFPLLASSSDRKLTNWAGNFEYSTEKQFSANSLKDVQEFVRSRNRFKVLGSRHCFNKIADTTSEFLSLKSMDHVVALNPDARTVTIESGMTYGQLCPYLDSQGWALHNLASLPHISVAGACSTATHGSGEPRTIRDHSP
jgi:xylitol oxidase